MAFLINGLDIEVSSFNTPSPNKFINASLVSFNVYNLATSSSEENTG